MEIRDILWPFCIHLVHFSCFGIMYQEKSDNPDGACILSEHDSPVDVTDWFRESNIGKKTREPIVRLLNLQITTPALYV
jgi:hypothetical protein